MSHALVACVLLGIAGASAAADLPRCENLKVAEALSPPEYPPSGHTPEGKVLVEFTVDTQGRVSDPQIVESSNERLSAASLKEAVRWRFVPPKQPCRHRVPITYRIKD